MKLKKHFIFLTVALIGLMGYLTFWFSKPQSTIKLQPVSFKKLPGWDRADLKASLETFQISCKTFLRQNPDNDAGSYTISLKVKDWQPACKEALSLTNIDNESAKTFFQKWFSPVEFNNKHPLKGLFTGYYMPLLQGSLVKTDQFNIPLYGPPSNLISVNLTDFDPQYAHRQLIGRLAGNKLLPYYSRAEINKGAIKNEAPVIVWVNSAIDRLFLEIQGSGVVVLPDGKRLYVGYAGENGASYTPVGRVLIEKGVMTKETASMQAIRTYLEAHPDQIDPVINQNKSFVFFKVLTQTAALGAQGVALTPGYSLAIDRKWIPLGAPLWLHTTHPDQFHQDKKVLQRLMIAQDTGGAIRGMVRGDVFWGAGKRATDIAGKMKNEGHYWLLLPKQVISNLPKTLSEN